MSERLSRLKGALRMVDICAMRQSSFEKLIKELDELRKDSYDLQFISALAPEHAGRLIELLSKSRAQLHQDLFVLAQLAFKTNGYFVEFGAASGVHLSNTYLLEKKFSWNGILAEPAQCWHADLKSNRSCQIDTDCVWKESNVCLTFQEAEVAELSKIENSAACDHDIDQHEIRKAYLVKSISLMDLLRKYQAPAIIDYLSVDTEGTEYEILSGFDFERYQFRVITCEHNFGPGRDPVRSLLSKFGYVRKFEHLSKFDDWYVHPELLP